jgi:hypothetical protein
LSDIEVGTIQDVYADEIEHGDSSIISPMRIILAGVGQVTGHDVAVAQAAQAVIVTYNVGVEKTALKEMKVRCSSFFFSPLISDCNFRSMALSRKNLKKFRTLLSLSCKREQQF